MASAESQSQRLRSLTKAGRAAYHDAVKQSRLLASEGFVLGLGGCFGSLFVPCAFIACSYV